MVCFENAQNICALALHKEVMLFLEIVTFPSIVTGCRKSLNVHHAFELAYTCMNSQFS